MLGAAASQTLTCGNVLQVIPKVRPACTPLQGHHRGDFKQSKTSLQKHRGVVVACSLYVDSRGEVMAHLVKKTTMGISLVLVVIKIQEAVDGEI